MTPMLLQMSLTYTADILQESINIIIIGRLNDTQALAAVGFSYMLIYVFIMSTAFGLNTALETLIAQAHGAGRLELCGKYLNRQRWITCIWFIILLICFLAASPVLYAGQDPAIANISRQFVLASFPGLLFLAQADSTRTLLVAIDEPGASTFIVIGGVILSTTLNYTFVHTLGYGVFGLPIGFAISEFILFMVTSLYCHFTSNKTVRQVWSLPGLDSFSQWREILDLGLPGAFLYFIDWGAIYSLGLFSGLMGVAELTTMTCVLVIQPLSIVFGIGMELTNSVFVGNSIGSGQIKNAKMFAKSSILLVLVISLIVSSVLFAFKDSIGYLYSTDPAVLALFPATITSLCVFISIDSL